MLKHLRILFMSTFFGVIPPFLYWLGGGDIIVEGAVVRSLNLSFAVGAGLFLFLLAAGIMVLDTRMNRKTPRY